jgi:imidazole glycerol-phosphate synthase subunit HisH
MTSKNDILIINYNMGNIGSVANMLKKIGANVHISSNPNDIAKANKLILPGIGAFDHGMSSLNELGLIEILNEKVINDNTPILGICLGMHLLTKKSEEGSLPGLSWIDASTLKFLFNDTNNKLRIPHMGWNSLVKINDNTLFSNIDLSENRFYFVHSYYVNCINKNDVAAETNYGNIFASSIRKNNIFGTQFHPEKSHKFGMQILKNFLNFNKNCET